MPDLPPTDRLDQRDSYLTTFQGQVTATDRIEGDLWVALNRSAFYPDSGGQPPDHGTLADLRIADVQVRDGTVWHRVEGGTVSVGEELPGTVDWERRFRHMQRHTAQHLLSQAFLQVSAAFTTESVGLTGPDLTLDLAGDPDVGALSQAEAVANRAVYANLAITAFEVDERDLADYPLRRPPKVSGRIRLVKMGDFELSACGGTHLRSTAEAAPIKVLSAENIRGALTRVTFRAGLEALEDYRRKHEVASQLAVSFSARVGEVPERVQAVRDAAASAEQALDQARDRLAGALADRLRADAQRLGDRAIVKHVLDPADATLLRPVGLALMGHDATIALLAVVAGGKAQVLLARSPDLDVDLRPVLRAALEEIEGRGGGRPELVQGGGPGTDRVSEALERAWNSLREQP